MIQERNWQLVTAARLGILGGVLAGLGLFNGPYHLAYALSDDGELTANTARSLGALRWLVGLGGLCLVPGVLIWKSPWLRSARQWLDRDLDRFAAEGPSDSRANVARVARRWLIVMAGLLPLIALFCFSERLLPASVFSQWEVVAYGELGLIENGTIGVLLATSVVLLVATKRRIAHGGWRWAALAPIVLAFGAFLVAGEESSWGQHWLHFSTPAPMEGLNEQEELNFHNVATAASNMVMELLFVTSTLIYPLALRWFRDVRYARERLWLPHAPLRFAAWYLASLVIMQRIYGWLDIESILTRRTDETRELMFAVVTLAIASCTLTAWKAVAPGPESRVAGAGASTHRTEAAS